MEGRLQPPCVLPAGVVFLLGCDPGMPPPARPELGPKTKHSAFLLLLFVVCITHTLTHSHSLIHSQYLFPDVIPAPASFQLQLQGR